jgi:serine/threonine protein kinase
VLIDGDGKAMIGDFGLAVAMDGLTTGFTNSVFVATWRYLSPEAAENETRTMEADIYAVACTCFQVRSKYLFDINCSNKTG